MTDFGPFSVAADSVTRLGATNFGPVVNRLLSMESARAGMAGSALEATHIENLSDGGVDAALRHAHETRWIPADDSAWQFKAGDLGPAACKKELRGAHGAQTILRAGGKYRLVLGVSLSVPTLAARKEALREEASDLGLMVEDDTFEVFTADTLARWIEEHPALAVNPVLRGISTSAVSFDTWSESIRSVDTRWATSEENDAAMVELRDRITAGADRDIRVEGVSGVGKTRFVLEALRGQPYEPIVLYVPAADQFHAPLLNHLAVDGRAAVVVVDDCDRRTHEALARALTTTSATRLITVGDPGPRAARSSVITISGLDNTAMAGVIELNVPEIQSEARRVIVEIAAGNVDFALYAARALGHNIASAGALISVDDVRTWMQADLPHGALFSASAALALFTRVGFDGDVSGELTSIATGLGLSENDLRDAARELENSNLLSTQGRYRSVKPHPVAVFFAGAGWKDLGDRIVANLLPDLDPILLERLLRRATDVGEFDASERVVSALMTPGGAAPSLSGLVRISPVLPHLAVIEPVLVVRLLDDLIAGATDTELIAHNATRRDLVIALGKLAWNTRTFERAAQALLRLATVETEQWANNATGTWIELFGTVLPGTAAAPDDRISFLEDVAGSDDFERRLLAVKGLSQSLALHGSIIVSSELQGGRIVEPRAMASNAEAVSYITSAIDLLRALVDDPDPQVSAAALKALLAALHSLIDITPVRGHLGKALSTLPPSSLRSARAEIAEMLSLYDRVTDAYGRRPLIEELEAALPSPSAHDELWILAHSNRWDYKEDDLRRRLLETARKTDDAVQVLLDFLTEPNVLGAATEMGWSLAQLHPEAIPPELIGTIDTANDQALIGYLWGRVEAGEHYAFDRFVDGAELTVEQSLRLTASGRYSARADERIKVLIEKVTPARGAVALFGWAGLAGDHDVAHYLRVWTPRIRNQADYDAVVDYAGLHAHHLGSPLPEFDELLLPLLTRRSEFAGMSRHEYEWDSLARRAAERSPLEVVTLFADLIEADAVTVFVGGPVQQALEGIVRHAGSMAWTLLVDRIDAGSWRLSLAGRGWLADSGDLVAARGWVGENVERARVLASLTSRGESTASPATRFLIDSFGSDDVVRSELLDRFGGDSWTGELSGYFSHQIDLLREWIAEPDATRPMKSWARWAIGLLETLRDKASAREAERGW